MPVDAPLELTTPAPYVGRGGEKLAPVLREFGVAPAGRVCLDVGASTGGFTDCLLGMGAAHVYAVDVGRGQLHERLRADPRVTVMEGRNARALESGDLPVAPSLAVIDVSFISLEKVLVVVARCLGQPGRIGVVVDPPPPAFLATRGSATLEIVALVKPQFEVGRGQVGKGGVVRDPKRQRTALLRVAGFAEEHGLAVWHVGASPLRGAKGNREFFLHLVLREREGGRRPSEDLGTAVDRAVASAPAGPSGRA